MVAPTKFMGTLRAKLGLIYEFKKLVYVYEELPQSLTRQLPLWKEPLLDTLLFVSIQFTV